MGSSAGGDGRILPASETCAPQEVYIITLPVDGIQLQSLILTGTGVGTEATLSYSPASSEGVDTKTSTDDVKPDVTEDAERKPATMAGPDVAQKALDVTQKAPCSGLDTLAAVADRLRQEMLDEEAAEHGEVDFNAKLDGLFLLCVAIIVVCFLVLLRIVV